MLTKIVEGIKSTSAAFLTLFSAFSVLRIFPQIAIEFMFKAIRTVPMFEVMGPQKMVALKPAYTELGQQKFHNYDRYAHEHCIDYIASHAFN